MNFLNICLFIKLESLLSNLLFQLNARINLPPAMQQRSTHYHDTNEAGPSTSNNTITYFESGCKWAIYPILSGYFVNFITSQFMSKSQCFSCLFFFQKKHTNRFEFFSFQKSRCFFLEKTQHWWKYIQKHHFHYSSFGVNFLTIGIMVAKNSYFL